VLFNQPLNPIEFNTTKPAALLQPHRVEPEFRVAPVALDMDVRRLIAVARVKEKTIRPDL
jgi:hypothetical protein